MAESIKEHLQEAFEDLGADNLRRFKSKLGDRRQGPRVSKSTIEKLKDEIDLADLMVNTFTSKDAVSVTVEILRAIKCNAVADDLLKNTGQSESQGAPSEAESKGAPSKESKAAFSKVNFIDDHWIELIDRVNNVDPVLDVLRQKKVITNEDYCTIRTKETPQKKMRELLTGPITSAGNKGKEILYEALRENNRFLMDDLENAQ
ncbi:apoptosis-associated speck-like protein containing a CARD isoform X2 [Danio aesculapii]|uniref:apoptosis-associated speck-like protein containing a CARD isoform X2 n=1 Tax=Danio aesculapii TaxID=1142201 RepID=UPI0024C0C957|nr:apoptosis-associated speck-like protein containing a CARD isoform X2 [Danio aesculapii]